MAAQAGQPAGDDRRAAARVAHRHLVGIDLPAREQLRERGQFGFRRLGEARGQALRFGVHGSRCRCGRRRRRLCRRGLSIPLQPQRAGTDRQQQQRGRGPQSVAAHPVARVAGQGLVGGAVDQAFADAVLLARVGGHQRAVGDDVDQPRNAAGALVEGLQAEPRERHALAAGDRHAVTHVGLGLGDVQRRQVVARGDALGELAQFRAVEQLAQFRLAEQDDLQQLLRRRFEVGQQAHLFERLDRQVLRLVDDQHHAQALRVGVEQERVQRVGQRLEAAALALDRQLQLLADGLHQFHRRELGVEHQGDARVLRQLVRAAAGTAWSCRCRPRPSAARSRRCRPCRCRRAGARARPGAVRTGRRSAGPA